MEDRPFAERATEPNEANLRACLGSAYDYYLAAGDLAGGFKQEWHYYKGSGWMLKVSDGKKALFYLIPLRKAVQISLTVRENEKAVLLAGGKLRSGLGASLAAAKKYPEGYLIHMLIDVKEAYASFEDLIRELIKMR